MLRWSYIYTDYCLLLQVKYEGWHVNWETGPSALPKADQDWLLNDPVHGLFQPVQRYVVGAGESKYRKVLKNQMWFYPPEMPGCIDKVPGSADPFFHARVFFWRPVACWTYSFRCPNANCPAQDDPRAFLYK